MIPARSQQGFTLVETIIAISLTALLMIVIINFMMNNIVEYAQANAKAELLSEAQVGIDIIANDIRLSANADINNRWPDDNAPGAPSDTFSWASDNDTLVLATAAEDQNGNIIFSDPNLYISEKNNNVYFLNGSTLYKRTIASSVANNSAKTTCPASTSTCSIDKALLHNVATFNATYYNDQNQQVTPTDARSIELYVKLQKPQYSQPISVEYKTRMVFRND